jgi:hypothetical protein
MKRMMNPRWPDLQKASPHGLRPIHGREAQAAIEHAQKMGLEVEFDAPVGANDSLLFYVLLCNDDRIAYLSQ